MSPHGWSSERRVVGRTVAPMPDVVRLLEETPPHRLPEKLVALAGEAAGCRVAMYVIDIGGARLRLLADGDGFPDEIAVPQALGGELARGRMGEVQGRVAAALDGAVAVPLWVHGRAVAVLVAERAPRQELEPLARQAAAAVELADRYTDVFGRKRRHRPTTAAAEIQDGLLRPGFVELEGADIAAGIVPAYEVGGDWYDYAENSEGVWVAVADAVGKGSRAAGASTVALGALRASRHAELGLEDAGRAMDQALKELGDPGVFVTAVLARYEPGRRALRWLRFGHPLPIVLASDGMVAELEEPGYLPLGLLPEAAVLTCGEIALRGDERLVLTSDGVWERRLPGGGFFGVQRLAEVLAELGAESAAGLATSVMSAVMDAQSEPPRDDATVLVLAGRA